RTCLARRCADLGADPDPARGAAGAYRTAPGTLRKDRRRHRRVSAVFAVDRHGPGVDRQGPDLGCLRPVVGACADADLGAAADRKAPEPAAVAAMTSRLGRYLIRTI